MTSNKEKINPNNALKGLGKSFELKSKSNTPEPNLDFLKKNQSPIEPKVLDSEGLEQQVKKEEKSSILLSTPSEKKEINEIIEQEVTNGSASENKKDKSLDQEIKKESAPGEDEFQLINTTVSRAKKGKQSKSENERGLNQVSIRSDVKKKFDILCKMTGERGVDYMGELILKDIKRRGLEEDIEMFIKKFSNKTKN